MWIATPIRKQTSPNCFCTLFSLKVVIYRKNILQGNLLWNTPLSLQRILSFRVYEWKTWLPYCKFCRKHNPSSQTRVKKSVKFITAPGGSEPQNSSYSSGMVPDITATKQEEDMGGCHQAGVWQIRSAYRIFVRNSKWNIFLFRNMVVDEFTMLQWSANNYEIWSIKSLATNWAATTLFLAVAKISHFATTCCGIHLASSPTGSEEFSPALLTRGVIPLVHAYSYFLYARWWWWWWWWY